MHRIKQAGAHGSWAWKSSGRAPGQCCQPDLNQKWSAARPASACPCLSCASWLTWMCLQWRHLLAMLIHASSRVHSTLMSMGAPTKQVQCTKHAAWTAKGFGGSPGKAGKSSALRFPPPRLPAAAR